KVTVLTPDWGIEKKIDAEALAGIERSPFGWRREEAGVQAIYLPTWLRKRALSWNPAVKRYCRARLQNFDIVHIFGLYDLLGPAVAAECRRRGRPLYVIEPIGMFLPIVRNIWLKRLYHSLLGKRLLRGAAAVIATSDQEVDELRSGGLQQEKIVLRRNGVEAPKEWPEPGAFRRQHGIQPYAKLLLFLGRLSWKKSPELLLKAVASLPGQLRERDLRIVFAGPDEGGVGKELRAIATQLGLGQQTDFVGPVYGSAKWAAYRDADLFVLPSQNENFGNSAAEAVVAGTPAIVTQQCGIAPLLTGEAGFVVGHDALALSGALARIMSEPGLPGELATGWSQVRARLPCEETGRAVETL